MWPTIKLLKITRVLTHGHTLELQSQWEQSPFDCPQVCLLLQIYTVHVVLRSPTSPNFRIWSPKNETWYTYRYTRFTYLNFLDFHVFLTMETLQGHMILDTTHSANSFVENPLYKDCPFINSINHIPHLLMVIVPFAVAY